MKRHTIDRAGRLHIKLLGRCRSQQPCGIKAAPPHLPHALLCLPGETVEQLAHRALQTATGQGVVLACLMYPDEVAH